MRALLNMSLGKKKHNKYNTHNRLFRERGVKKWVEYWFSSFSISILISHLITQDNRLHINSKISAARRTWYQCDLLSPILSAQQTERLILNSNNSNIDGELEIFSSIKWLESIILQIKQNINSYLIPCNTPQSEFQN